MGRSVNKVILIGNLGRDAESRQAGDATVVNFSVATSRRWKARDSEEWKEETDWVNVVAWRAENIVSFLTKGRQVYVEGRIQTRSYDKNGVRVYVTEVIAEQVLLLGGNDGDRTPAKETSAETEKRAPATSPWPHVNDPAADDDVPF